jgi:RimJ/RimL family protein N-acetyltransferase
MTNIQLIRLDSDLERALATDVTYMKALAQGEWAQVADVVHRVIGRTLIADPVSIDELQWGGYFVVDEGTREMIGSCGFKGAPTEDGTVEIAYFTYPGFEGRGFATRMAKKLIELARSAPGVRRVIAHTLPEKSASTRVLEKVGMTFTGEVIDPDDGPVWRWEMRCGTRRISSGVDA